MTVPRSALLKDGYIMALAICATCMNIDLIGRPSSASAFAHIASLSSVAPTTRIVLPPQSGFTFSSNRQSRRPRDTSNHIVASQPSFSWAVFSSSQNYIDGTISVTRQQPPKADRSSKISSRLGNDPKKTKKKRRDNIVDSDSFASSGEGFASIELSMYYRIYNPNYCCRSSDSGDVESGDKNKLAAKAPIVILHGGPSLPSQYLYSVVDNIPSDRPIIFYDQIGCGRSSEPTDVRLYGIPQSIDDLEKLLDELNIGAFHLLGHSYGGALAYEYAKRVSERRPSTSTLLSSPHCLSIIIANTSTSMQKGNEEWDRLFSECASDISLPGATPHDKFFRRNQCRLDTIPKDLSSAFDHCGKVWVGTDVVADWVAVPPNPTIMMGHGDSEEGEHFQEMLPPFLVVTGEYDFITQSCTLGWKDILCEALIDEKMMESCSHYVHFEQPELFGNIVEEFVLRYDQ